jgi:heme/copper-type cytochrome/quinol oxidase subunit 4
LESQSQYGTLLFIIIIIIIIIIIMNYVMRPLEEHAGPSV